MNFSAASGVFGHLVDQGSTRRNSDSRAAWPFCARSCAILAMVSRVSLALLCSARFQEFSKIVCRVSRLLSVARSGCCVVFCKGIT